MSRSPFSHAFAALLYGAICLTANAAPADELSSADRSSLKQLRSGDMLKLVLHDKPRARIAETFRDLYGNPLTLADYSGKVVLLNIWATWCPPCRAEMPSIDRLAGAMEGKDFAVIPLSTDRAGAERVAQFYRDILIENLDVLHDRSGNLLPLLENAYTDSVREEDRDETVWREAKRLCAGTGTFQTTDPDKANDVYQAVEELGYDCDCTRTRHAPLSLPGTTTYNRGCEVFTLRAI